MRAIQTEEQREKQRKRNTQIIGVVLAVLMLGSTIGYAFSLFFSSSEPAPALPNTPSPSQPAIVAYNGLSFALASTQSEISSVPINIALRISDYSGATVFIASDNNAATQELAGILGNYVGRVQEACYGPCTSDLPEKGCTDNLIVVRQSNEPSVRQEDKCAIINGDIKAVDAFLYTLFRPS